MNEFIACHTSGSQTPPQPSWWALLHYPEAHVYRAVIHILDACRVPAARLDEPDPGTARPVPGTSDSGIALGRDAGNTQEAGLLHDMLGAAGRAAGYQELVAICRVAGRARRSGGQV